MKYLFPVILYFACLSCQGAIITYTASGTISELDRQGVTPAGYFVLGDPLIARMTIDTSTPDSDPINVDYGAYWGAVTDAELAIGSASWHWSNATDSSSVRIHLHDRDGREYIDTVINHQTDRRYYMVLNLTNLTDDDVIVSDQLPFNPFGSFDQSSVYLFDFQERGPLPGHGYDWYYRAVAHDVTWHVSAIPIPATAWLFGSAVGVMGWIRRKATV